MSRHEFENLVIAAEKSFRIRNQIYQCKSKEDLVKLANKIGFHITNNDLEDDKCISKFGLWAEESKITGIRRNILN